MSLTVIPHVDDGNGGVASGGLFSKDQLRERRCRKTLQRADCRHFACRKLMSRGLENIDWDFARDLDPLAKIGR